MTNKLVCFCGNCVVTRARACNCVGSCECGKTRCIRCAETLPVPTEYFEKTTRIMVSTFSDGTKYQHTANLGVFLIENEFSSDECAAIRKAVAAGRIYRHGGGASPIFEIERA